MQEDREPLKTSLHALLEKVLTDQDESAVVAELEMRLLADRERSPAFGITPATVGAAVKARSHLLRAIYPRFEQLCRDFRWTTPPLETLWTLWLPLAMELVACRQTLGRPLVQGILGGQGTGKSTLAAVLIQILSHLGYQVCTLSIDDLYKTYAERQQLQAQDPRWRWRGPPGTHDVNLGLQALQQLKAGPSGQSVALPRFDKSLWQGAGDRTEPEWVTGIDIVFFEGWFVGVRPVDPAVFENAPPPIHTESDRQFAREVNAKLQDYLPLWDQLDRLLLLYPEDYRLSQQWRRQAEQQMMATGKTGMGEEEINQFVEYFWRSLHPELFIEPLRHDADHVDLVIEIRPDHTPGAVYRPHDRL